VYETWNMGYERETRHIYHLCNPLNGCSLLLNHKSAGNPTHTHNELVRLEGHSAAGGLSQMNRSIPQALWTHPFIRTEND
jgi:hypothetical protein